VRGGKCNQLGAGMDRNETHLYRGLDVVPLRPPAGRVNGA